MYTSHSSKCNILCCFYVTKLNGKVTCNKIKVSILDPCFLTEPTEGTQGPPRFWACPISEEARAHPGLERLDL